ncbi:MAG: OmpA family protein [Alphaproteobacteria bacterium]|nr:OmpA family protein [Alphaproteobacteria bacterium]
MFKKIGLLAVVVALSACAGNFGSGGNGNSMNTPTVDYIEGLDVRRAEHNDSFLSRLALNYRSFAIFNARTVGDPAGGELFAQKAVAAFSGDLPHPESPVTWNMMGHRELNAGYDLLMNLLRAGGPIAHPELSAQAQVQFDCWIFGAATGMNAAARDCHAKFNRSISRLADGMEGMDRNRIQQIAAQRRQGAAPVRGSTDMDEFISRGDTVTDGFDDQGRPTRTHSTRSGHTTFSSSSKEDDGRVIVINNINIPENLIRPVPVSQPVVFNQKIFHNGEQISESDEELEFRPEPGRARDPGMVSRDEFINIMLALREELAEINSRLDNAGGGFGDGDAEVELAIKIQQIPLSPQQSIMEEIFEVRFDFNKSDITPEYREVIRKLARTAQANQNVKISVVGHTDTVGTQDFNFALGGRRAKAVRDLLISYGIPANQIVATSSGKNDLKVPTGDQVRNAQNRRVRVVKETPGTEIAPHAQGTNNIRVTVDGDAEVRIEHLEE